MAKKKDRIAPFEVSSPADTPKTDKELDREEALERLDRLEWDDNRQKDRELQQAFQDIDDAQINKVGVKYDSRTKLRAALAYVTTASSKEASKLTGVPAATIRYWKQEAPWWPQAVKYALSAQKEGLDAKLGQIVDKALESTMERLALGDPTIIKDAYKDLSTGETVTKIRVEYTPIKAKDLMVIASIGRDKQSILRGEPTSISEKKSDKEVLEDVAAKLVEAIGQGKAPKSILGTYNSDGEEVSDD